MVVSRSCWPMPYRGASEVQIWLMVVSAVPTIFSDRTLRVGSNQAALNCAQAVEELDAVAEAGIVVVGGAVLFVVLGAVLQGVHIVVAVVVQHEGAVDLLVQVGQLLGGLDVLLPGPALGGGDLHAGVLKHLGVAACRKTTRFRGNPFLRAYARQKFLPPNIPLGTKFDAEPCTWPCGLAHSQRQISLYVSRPSAHVGWTGLFRQSETPWC